MGLHIYYKNSEDIYVEVSTDNDTSSPIVTAHDGKNGDQKTLCLYLRNDNSAKWYSHIFITPTDLDDDIENDDVIYTKTGWGVKVRAGGLEPTSSEWNFYDWGDAIQMDDIGDVGSPDTTTYYPFWYLITCPPGSEAQNKKNISLRISAIENAI